MSNHGVRSGVGWLDSMVADEAKIQLIVFAWNATMVQAKTLKCVSELEVQETSKEAEQPKSYGINITGIHVKCVWFTMICGSMI